MCDHVLVRVIDFGKVTVQKKNWVQRAWCRIIFAATIALNTRHESALSRSTFMQAWW